MVKPVYSIDFYTPGGVARSSVSTLSFDIKKVLTESVGKFSVTVDGDANSATIALHDEVRIKLGYDVLPATYIFRGRVTRIEGSLGVSGRTKIISGLDRGEILLRRLKNKYYMATDASVAAEEWATDLGLADQVVADANHVELDLSDTNYFEALQQVCDYWITGPTQLSKDFYVDEDFALWLKDRTPAWRTVGVETLMVGSNILNYTVNQTLENLKNNITVYGGWDDKLTTNIPSNENWTEGDGSLAYWTAVLGTVVVDHAFAVVGTHSIIATAADDGVDFHANFYRTFEPEFGTVSGNPNRGTHSFSRIHYHSSCNIGGPITMQIWLLAPDIANYFYKTTGPAYTGAWIEDNKDLAGAAVAWSETGTPNWDALTAVYFYSNNAGAYTLNIDGLALQGGRFRASTTNGTSITNYGQRDLVQIDDKLLSNAYCTSRANTLLYELEGVTKEVTIDVAGNTNILLGDELTLTLPNEGVTAEPFYVTAVEHFLSGNPPEFYTRATLLNTAVSRETVKWNPVVELSKMRQRINRLSNQTRLIR